MKVLNLFSLSNSKIYYPLLTEKGLVLISSTTHAKLIIIDKKISILGSNNWTYYSLTKNNETSVIITSEGVAGMFREYFEKIVNK